MSLPHYKDVEVPEYESMKEAGRIAAETHEYLEPLIDDGQSTVELDREAEEFIREMGADPAFHDYKDSSHSITVSINDEVIHTHPRPDRTIKEGDVVSIDLGTKFEGHYSDTAVTHLVGTPVKSEHEELIERTKSALYAGVLQSIAGNTLRDVGKAIEEKSGSFGNVTGWAGHFIGRKLHLKPQIFNTAEQNQSFQLERGMYLAIEPILTISKNPKALERSAGGTVRLRSNEPGAHFEHTIRVGKDRAEILTSRSDEPDRL